MMGVGAVRGVAVEVTGTYVGTAGLVGVVTGGGGSMGGVLVIGDTTLTGLCGLGVIRGGGILMRDDGGKEGDF